jgi:ABC-type sugar transport system permease subunit
MSTSTILDSATNAVPGLESTDTIRALGFLTPLAVFYVPFLIVPALLLWVMSFFAGSSLTNLEFVGLANYEFLLNDGVIFLALQNTVLYTIGHTILTVGLGLVVAEAILASYSFMQKYLRFLYMVPMAMMGVAVGFIWNYMYHPRQGAIPIFVRAIDPDAFLNILGNPELVLSAIMLVGGWKGIGFYTTIWMIALLNVDEKYYEAARLEGVGRWATFRHITIPLTKPIGMFLLLVSVIGSMKMFAYFWVMTEGGPNHASEVLITYMYKLGFKQNAFGKAAAVGVVLFISVLVFTIIIERVVGLETEYERAV